MARPNVRRAEARKAIQFTRMTGGNMLAAVKRLQKIRKRKQTGGSLGTVATHISELKDVGRITKR